MGLFGAGEALLSHHNFHAPHDRQVGVMDERDLHYATVWPKACSRSKDEIRLPPDYRSRGLLFYRS